MMNTMQWTWRMGLGLGVLLGLADSAHAVNYWWNGTTNNYTSQNWESPSGTPSTGTPGDWESIYNTKGGKVILTNTKGPGYFKFVSGELEIQAGGTLNPAGGGGASISDGPARITVNGGTLTGMGPMGPSAAGAVLNLRVGTWTKTGYDNFYARLGGRINHTGGTLAVGTFSLSLGFQDMWSNSSGDYYLGDANGSAGTVTGSGSLILGNISSKMAGSGYRYTTYGTLIGHGTVGLTGTLRNNGYVIADGYGTERTLNLSSFTTVDNTVDNNEYKLSGDNNYYWGKGGTGWFATRKAKLTLPALTVATGAGSYNWGEKSSDSDIDLINAVRLSFAAVTTGGSLSIALLATNRSEVVDTRGKLLSVWQVSAPSVAFTAATPVVRYDDVLAASLGLAEANLKLYARAGLGSAWNDITASIDTTKNQLTGTSLNSLGMLAVGKDVSLVPPAGTLVGVR